MTDKVIIQRLLNGETMTNLQEELHCRYETLQSIVKRYLSPKEYYTERGYEVTYSRFGPEAADIVVKKTLTMLYKQYK